MIHRHEAQLPETCAMTEAQQQNLFAKVQHALHRNQQDLRPVVLMTCGLAGSGKTTLAKAILARLPHFHRLSMDEIIASNHGIYGIDYPPSSTLYAQFLSEADVVYSATFSRLLAAKQDIILEKSFYSKEDRDEYRKRVEESGGRLVLVVLKGRDRESSWQRVVERKKEVKGANNALEIEKGVFDAYWDGFEWPGEEEGVIVIDVV